MSCEGCNPENHVGMKPPVVSSQTGFARGEKFYGIGTMNQTPQQPPRPWPQQAAASMPADVARAIDGAVSVATDQSLRINPSKFKDVHPLVFDLMEQQRKLEVELATLTAILLKKELVTEAQLNQYRFLVNQSMAEQFQKQIGQLGRLLGQRPPNSPSPVPPPKSQTTDPRRPPS